MSTAFINDTELYYVTVGEGLPCLVMHGGLALDHTYLHPWLDPLGDILHLVYYDHRGNGRSASPARETMTHAQFVDDAEAFALHLGFDEVVVIGHSYGGFIALEFALRYPNRLSHLILLDTAPNTDFSEDVLANALRKGATEEMIVLLQSSFSSNEESRHQLETILPLYFKTFNSDIAQRLLEDVIINVSGRALEGELSAYNVVPRLDEIQVPTLILVGRDDFMCPPSQAEILYNGIANSELVIFENSGHFPYVEESGAFFKAVWDWMTEVIPLSAGDNSS